MTVEIPVWLLYVIYFVGGLFGLLIIGAILFLAYLGWVFIKCLEGPWR